MHTSTPIQEAQRGTRCAALAHGGAVSARRTSRVLRAVPAGFARNTRPLTFVAAPDSGEQA
jgi:hypothetical protein